MSRPKFLPDNFTLSLIGTLVVASLLPCRGAAAATVDDLTNVAIALLFFLHGAKLSREAVMAAASHWRLHVLVLLITFVVFVLRLFVPFVCGQLLRPLIGGWIQRNESIVSGVDQGSILLIVYSAFSEAVGAGLWRQVPPSALAGLLVADGVLLAAALITTVLVSKWLGFERADRVTIVFCGSKKSLSQGITIAKVIFASHVVGAAILPLMIFHQIQLMVCAALAQRWGRRAEPFPSPASADAKSLLPH